MRQNYGHNGPPGSVRTAVRLFLATVVLGFAEVAIPGNPSRAMFHLFPSAILVGIIVLYGLGAIVLWGIYRGKNWARMIVTVLTVLSIPFMLLTIPESLSENALIGIIEIVNAGLSIIAVAYLFSAESSTWFRRQQSD